MKKFIFFFGLTVGLSVVLSVCVLNTNAYASPSCVKEEECSQVSSIMSKMVRLQNGKSISDTLKSLKQEIKYNEALVAPFRRAVPNQVGSLYDSIPLAECSLIQKSNRRIHEYIVMIYCITDKQQENSLLTHTRDLWK